MDRNMTSTPRAYLYRSRSRWFCQWILILVLGLCLRCYHRTGNDPDARPFFEVTRSITDDDDDDDNNAKANVWSVLTLMLSVIESCVWGYFMTFTVSFKRYVVDLTSANRKGGSMRRIQLCLFVS